MLLSASFHLPTFLICAALVAVVALIIVRLVRNKKRGRTSCGCGCANCPMSASCHRPAKTDTPPDDSDDA